MSRKIFCAVIIVLISFGLITSAAFAESENQPEKALKCTITFMKQPEKNNPVFGGISLNGYDYYKYKFSAGDVIEYEVYLDTKIAGIGYLDVQCSKPVKVDSDGNETHDWVYIRPGGDHPEQALIMDEQNIAVDRNVDLTNAAYKKWYKRRIKVPDWLANGYSARHWCPYAYAAVDLPTSGSETATVYYRNIRVVDKDGNVKMVISDDSEEYFSGDLYDVNGVEVKVESVNVFPGSKPLAQPQTEPESTLPDNGEEKNTEDATSSNNLFVVISVAAVVIIAGGVTIFIVKKRRK